MIDIAKRARSLKGVPFVHQGRDKNGIDCVGLLAYAVDYSVDKLPPYPPDPINGELEAALTAILGAPILLKPTDCSEFKEGDLAAMQYRGPVRHVGIILDHPTIKGAFSLIHTDSMVGEVTEHILDAKWLRRIEKIWRLESV